MHRAGQGLPLAERLGDAGVVALDVADPELGDLPVALLHLADGPFERDHRLRSEEHTSELQSPCNLVCRLLLEKKKHSNTILAHLVPLSTALTINSDYHEGHLVPAKYNATQKVLPSILMRMHYLSAPVAPIQTI